MSDRPELHDEIAFSSWEQATAVEYNRVAALWALRILVRLGGLKRLSRTVMDEDEVFGALGLKAPTGEESIPPAELKRLWRVRLVKMEQNPPRKLGALRHNLRLLTKALSLSDVDCQILAFAVVIQNVSWLASVAESLGSLNRRMTFGALSKILDLRADKVQQAFASDGVLATSGILRLRDEPNELTHKLMLLDALASNLTVRHRDTRGMLKSFIRYVEPATLVRADYVHARSEWTLIRDYLAAVTHEKRAGANILIHGRPGTGKTQLVRALTTELGVTLCEVATQNAESDGLSATQRFGAYQLAQRMLMRSKCHAVLFDEMEDVFPTPASRFGVLTLAHEAISKAWMNRVLEENRVPCFWLSNHIEQIDPAYLRRFDLVIEMPEPTRSVRRKMLQRYLNGIPLTETWLDRMAENSDLMPAIIERTAKIIRSLKPADAGAAEQQFESVLYGSLEAMGHRMPRRAGNDELIPYRVEYLNPDRDLSGIVEGLKWRGQGRLCLYGPPGTGKTAYGKHIAKELDRPLLVKRASDLLSMWVGGTEKNIACMFREAEREQAVLLLDEADSFLQDRAGAQRSWEITQVNELLTQMEAFNGVFIASTNLMDTLDAASLRRFDFKVRFDYLNMKQREAMFTEALSALGVGGKTLDEVTRHRLQALDTMAPGDFAVVARQSKLRKLPFNQEELLGILAAECVVKEKGKHRFLGFTG